MITRRAPLKRTPLKPCRKPIARAPLKKKAPSNPMPPGRREEVLERDGYRCRNCGRSVARVGANVHHIKFKSHGVDHSKENLLTLCDFPLEAPVCHDRVHLKGNESEWLWIVGDATHAKFVTENPKRSL